MKTKTIAFNDFMSGAHKQKVSKKKAVTKIATSVTVPLALLSPRVSMAHSEGAPEVITASSEVVTAGASEWLGEQTLSALAHALDPVIDILVALSFPVASVIIVGGCFFFMLGNSEKAWSTIQNAGLGYVLIQVSPLILNVLKSVGGAV